jgi:hypothetical protein
MVDVEKLLLIRGHQGGYYIPKVDREIVADYVKAQSDEIDRLEARCRKLVDKLLEAERGTKEGGGHVETRNEYHAGKPKALRLAFQRRYDFSP